MTSSTNFNAQAVNPPVTEPTKSSLRKELDQLYDSHEVIVRHFLQTGEEYSRLQIDVIQNFSAQYFSKNWRARIEPSRLETEFEVREAELDEETIEPGEIPMTRSYVVESDDIGAAARAYLRGKKITWIDEKGIECATKGPEVFELDRLYREERFLIKQEQEQFDRRRAEIKEAISNLASKN